MSLKVATVSQLVSYLKGKLDHDLSIQKITIQGEISNFTAHRSGHWYFTLKDERSRIACVMFQTQARSCKIIPKSGDKVFVVANTSLFETSGQLQLYVQSLTLDGIGDLYYQYEQLKQKLNNLGMFSPEHKKRLKAYPMKIALVTGDKTAAREDVLTTLARRWPIAEIIEFPTLVQGEGAPTQIIEALRRADGINSDIILLVRGGGSIEDLWAFNDEAVAYCIFECSTPIVVGVGHEVDTTIADYVSDLRAPTPTAAAEMVTPSVEEELVKIAKYRQTITLAINHRLLISKKELVALKETKVFSDPHSLFAVSWMKVDNLSNQLRLVPSEFHKKRLAFESLKAILIKNTISSCYKTANSIKIKKQKIKEHTLNKIQTVNNDFVRNVTKLDAYSPLKSLSRGYVLAYQKQKLVKSKLEVVHDEVLTIKFSDGEVLTKPLITEEV